MIQTPNRAKYIIMPPRTGGCYYFLYLVKTLTKYISKGFCEEYIEVKKYVYLRAF